jgi:hypothetical protein
MKENDTTLHQLFELICPEFLLVPQISVVTPKVVQQQAQVTHTRVSVPAYAMIKMGVVDIKCHPCR